MRRPTKKQRLCLGERLAGRGELRARLDSRAQPRRNWTAMSTFPPPPPRLSRWPTRCPFSRKRPYGRLPSILDLRRDSDSVLAGYPPISWSATHLFGDRRDDFAGRYWRCSRTVLPKGFLRPVGRHRRGNVPQIRLNRTEQSECGQQRNCDVRHRRRVGDLAPFFEDVQRRFGGLVPGQLNHG